MGWGLIVKDVYLSRVTKSELPTRIQELEDYIEYCKKKLFALMIASPRTIRDIENNPIEWEDHVIFEMNDLWEDLEESISKLNLYRIALQDLDSVEED
jgi:hypothetical protein